MKIQTLSPHQIDRVATICRTQHSVSQIGLNDVYEVVIEFTTWHGDILTERIPRVDVHNGEWNYEKG